MTQFLITTAAPCLYILYVDIHTYTYKNYIGQNE